jgi:histidinol-phosphate aminotransferase
MMNRVRQPFNCNSIAQAAAKAALRDDAHVRFSRQTNAVGKAYLYGALNRIGIEYVESDGNFILVHLDKSGQKVADALMRKGVIVRPVVGYGFPNSIRVTIGKREENERFLDALKEVM